MERRRVRIGGGVNVDPFVVAGDMLPIGGGGGGDADNILPPIMRIDGNGVQLHITEPTANGRMRHMIIHAQEGGEDPDAHEVMAEAQVAAEEAAVVAQAFNQLNVPAHHFPDQNIIIRSGPNNTIVAGPNGYALYSVPLHRAMTDVNVRHPAELSIGGHMIVQDLAAQARRRQPPQAVRFVLRLCFNALMHPYEYAKVLMQLGHEPLAPINCRSILGRAMTILPNVHKYLKHIKRTDGFFGLYRGLGPRLLGNICSSILCNSLVNLAGLKPYHRAVDERPHQLREYLWNLARDAIIMTTAAVVSHPFYVISIRQMAQFVGRELIYDNVIDGFREVIDREGLTGLYAGFMPRLLYDLCVLFLTSTISNIFNRNCKQNVVQQQYNSAAVQMGAAFVMYPLQVVASCMASTGARLAACMPPCMPIYRQWTDCLSDLLARGDHLRGGILFYRPMPRIQIRYTDSFIGASTPRT
ncbi:mitochondrial carrier homolog 2 [Scaptodrosophila lebanonensis]|uniref:Mitochondrial carrier homolog 2 n=1 Tax=Drosophila lebanonensis TaxID=7225 RepID=A0A6J2TVJ0_DROLE|nr:mitochondrial carrier homolog 2 [Scaptodrosophila lebanonensis]